MVFLMGVRLGCQIHYTINPPIHIDRREPTIPAPKGMKYPGVDSLPTVEVVEFMRQNMNELLLAPAAAKNT